MNQPQTQPLKSYKRAKNLETPEVTAKYYLTNSKLLPAVIEAKKEGKLSNELAKMLMMLTRKYAQRPSFSGYTYKEDMISEALSNLCQNALKFNPEKSKNPFAYYTSCINNSFLQFLNDEKKHRRIRDQLLIDIGENPSYNFAEEHKSQQNGEFGNELNELKTNIEEAKVRVAQEAVDKIAADAKNAAEAAALAFAANEAVELEVAEAFESNLALDSEYRDAVVVHSSLLSFKDDE
jgi:DNA-directed RNA polymerase specialized sigma subunit